MCCGKSGCHCLGHTFHSRVPGSCLGYSVLLIQLPVNGPEKTQHRMYQIFESLLLEWDTQLEFLALGFSPAQPGLLWAFVEWTRMEAPFLSVSPSLCVSSCLPNKDRGWGGTLDMRCQCGTYKPTWKIRWGSWKWPSASQRAASGRNQAASTLNSDTQS